MHEETKSFVDQHEKQQNSKPHCVSRSENLSADKINAKEDSVGKNYDNWDKEQKNIVDDVKSSSCHHIINHDDMPSKVSSSCLETKSEGDSSSRKSDSSDSNSWIKVLDKEGLVVLCSLRRCLSI